MPSGAVQTIIVQRGDVLDAGTSVTLPISPVDISKSFVRLVGNMNTSALASTTAHHTPNQFHGKCEITSSTTVTISRLEPGKTEMRAPFEVWTVDGAAIALRGVGSITLANGDFTKDSGALTGVSSFDDCVVIQTFVQYDESTRSRGQSQSATVEIVSSGGVKVRATRTAAGGGTLEVGYAVLEFLHDDFTVHQLSGTVGSGSDAALALSSSVNWDKCWYCHSFSPGGGALEEHTVRLSELEDSGGVSRLGARCHGGTPGQAVIYIVEDAGGANAIKSAHTFSTTQTTNEILPLSLPVADTAHSTVWLSATVSGSGTAFPRSYYMANLQSAGGVQKYLGRTGNTIDLVGRVTEWPEKTLSAGGGAQSLTAPLFSLAPSIFAISIAPSGVAILPPSVDPSFNIDAPAIRPSAVKLSPPSIGSTAVALTPQMALGPASIVLPVKDIDEATAAPALIPGPVSAALPDLAATAEEQAPALATGSMTLAMPAVILADALHGHAVQAGAVALSIPPLANIGARYSPAITMGAIDLALPFSASVEQIAPHGLQLGGVTIIIPELAEGIVSQAPALGLGGVSIGAPVLNVPGQRAAPTLVLNGADLVLTNLLAAVDTRPPSLAPGSVIIGAVPLALPATAVAAAVVPPSLDIGAIVIGASSIAAAGERFPPALLDGGILLGAPAIDNPGMTWPASLTIGPVALAVPRVDAGASMPPPAILAGGVELSLPGLTVPNQAFGPGLFPSGPDLGLTGLSLDAVSFPPSLMPGAVNLGLPLAGLASSFHGPTFFVEIGFPARGDITAILPGERLSTQLAGTSKTPAQMMRGTITAKLAQTILTARAKR